MPDAILHHPKLTDLMLPELANKILQCKGAAEARPLIVSLLTSLCQHINLDLHPDQYRDLDFTLTPYGKAVSPTTAAQCAEDVERSRVFMQGVYQAVHERLNPERPVQLLYAGTGPLGWLVLPLLSLFSAKQLQITALDIHLFSLESFRNVCNTLNLGDRIADWVCADATVWQPAEGTTYDIILSETMNQFLEQEPQVQIFVNLQRYLAVGGSLIPQQVLLCAELESHDRQHQTHYPLGQVFDLNSESAIRLQQGETGILTATFPVPMSEACAVDIKLCTEIQVYRNFWLRENQSQLTLPKYRRQVRLSPGTNLTFNYQSGHLPKWQLQYQTASIELTPSSDLSGEGIYHLHRLWQKTLLKKLQISTELTTQPTADEWNLDRAVLDLIGTGLQPGMQLLHRCDSLSALQQEIRQLALSELQKQEINRQLKELSAALQPTAVPSVLSEKQLEFWRQNGYLVIPSVLTAAQCEQSRQAVWQHLQAEPEHPASWYQHLTLCEKIMLPLFRHPALDANRQVPVIRQIFEQLWQRTDLVMSTDRVSFNPPQTATWKFPGPGMHWDMELRTPVKFATQGLIYLTDTTAEQGAFCCVPGFHLQIEQWLQQQQDENTLQQQNWAQWPVKAIAAKAGDLIIWHHALPHGPSKNMTDQPRMVQYINMYPVAD